MRRILGALIAAALVASPALAHEKGGNAVGTVAAVGPGALEVLATDGHTVRYRVDAETRFTRAGKPARLEEVRVGERAAVHGRRDGDALVAGHVKLGPSPR